MSTIRETLLEVQGMTCRSCAGSVDGALRDVDGVEAIEIRFREGRVLVRHQEVASLGDLIGALDAAGFPARAA